MEFVNLYIQSEYTLLSSTVKLNNDFGKILSQDAVTSCAICDTNSMYGAIKFYNLCKAHNIKPIIGLKLNLKNNYSYDNNVLLYAKDNTGYVNLMKLSSYAKTNKVVTIEDLSKYSQGVLCILPASESEACKLFLSGKYDSFTKEYNKYSMFEDLYIGLDLQGVSKYSEVEEFYSKKTMFNFSFVGLHRVNYMSDEEFDAFKLLRCVDLNSNSYTPINNEEFWGYCHQNELLNEFRKYPELISATKEIANKCNVEIEFGKYKLPKYSNEITDTKKYLHDLCVFGLKRRLEKTGNLDKTNMYLARLNKELNVINKMGFNDYFLIVYDFIKWSKKNGILVGPGRGSGPSSLACYCLGITEIDPIKYDLLFERFLSEERITMPDIDTDFPDNKRDEVIKYVFNRYGAMKVAHISTFGTYGPKGALRDIARVKKIPDLFINELLKIVNNFSSIKDVEENDMFIRLINENSNLKEAVKLAKIIEGIPRNISTHAAGVIMTEEDLVNYTPLQPGMNGLYQTQYEASDLEKLGLLKMDFLGIRNLSIIDEVIEEIKRNENIVIDVNKIPLDDKKTFELISRGETEGIFQFESGGMRNVLTKYKPDNILHLAYVNALYRPGPMEMIPEFIECKFGRKNVSYLHNDLKEILAPTYGVIVFQEQIMLIAQKFAGYTLGEADILRRAVSKKKKEVLERERIKFVEKSGLLGYDSKVSNHIYDYIVKFANYGFNKSHAVVYSILGYQMAYLKTHYYKYFMANMMSSSINSVNLMRLYISSCKKHGIATLPPSINYSTNRFETYKRKNRSGQEVDVIYYPLIGINNVGGVIVKDILEERMENGLFKDFEDFVSRTKKIVNKRVATYLIYSGALDDFGLTRKAMVDKYEEVLMRSDYGILKDQLNEIEYPTEEYAFDEISNYELDALGLNIKYNFLLKYASVKKKYNCLNISELKVSSRSNILCVIRRLKTIKTKNNDEMAFLELGDGENIVDGVIFPKVYQNIKQVLRENEVYVLKGSLEVRNDKKQVIIENAFRL